MLAPEVGVTVNVTGVPALVELGLTVKPDRPNGLTLTVMAALVIVPALAVTLAVAVVVSVTTALPLPSVVAADGEMEPLSVANVTGTPPSGPPPSSVTVAVICALLLDEPSACGVEMMFTVFAAAVPIWPPAVFLLLAGAIGSLIVRASVARHLRVVTGAFRQLNPLIAAADTLSSLDSDPATGPLIGTLRADARRLARLRAIASWAGRDPTAAIGGDMVGLLFEYLNMVFWLDANALFFGSRQLRARRSELLRVLSAVGEVDAAISVASYRADSAGWTRPILRAGTAVLTEVRHPLLPDAVPNTIRLAPPHGVTITGSNMSGKSTFLRTVGVSAILAQTINTCLARRYEAPVFAVRSCIGRADDPATGKSYYLVEVESVLAMVHAARSTVPHLLLFDELFRGTNAVERIAAGEAVLLGLLAPRPAGGPSPHVVLAATHDQELVGLLDGIYAPHHFADTVDAAGLVFDYKLQPGARQAA